jgi:hypothetical protein
MTDASTFLNSTFPSGVAVRDELRAQGRVLFTDGSWSPQGFADEEHGVNPSEILYNAYWPEGELNSDWEPCDWIDGSRRDVCKPYERGEIVSALTKLDEGVGNMIFTDKGAWAPKIIQDLVEMGLDMGVWNVNSPASCFVTMCSVCGSCITKTFDDGTDPDRNIYSPDWILNEDSDWSSFFG